MTQRYNDNTKKPKLKENQLGILKIYVFYWKIQRRGSGPGESTSGVTYIFVRIHLRSCHILPLKVVQLQLVIQGKMQLQNSNHIVKVGVKATC